MGARARRASATRTTVLASRPDGTAPISVNVSIVVIDRVMPICDL